MASYAVPSFLTKEFFINFPLLHESYTIFKPYLSCIILTTSSSFIKSSFPPPVATYTFVRFFPISPEFPEFEATLIIIIITTSTAKIAKPIICFFFNFFTSYLILKSFSGSYPSALSIVSNTFISASVSIISD